MKNSSKKQVSFSPLNFWRSAYFQYQVKQDDQQTQIEMLLPEHLSHTTAFSQVKQFFTKKHPQMLQTTCFNAQNLPFDQEILNTEMGHLFEHLLLSLLAQAHAQSNTSQKDFTGTTQWNWKKHP